MDTTQLEAPQSEVAEAVVDQVIAPQNSVDRELAEALEALKAEEAKQAEPEIQAQAAQPGKEVQAEYKKPEHDKDPTAAIISLRKKLQETATQNLLLQGQVQALSSLHRGQTEGEQPEQVEVAPGKTAETLQSVRELKLALAEQFDQGDISAREMEQRRQELDDKEWQIREAARQPVVTPQADLQLEQATAKLEADYPILAILSADDMAPLAEIAIRQAEREGNTLQGAVGTLELRTRIAKLAQQMYGATNQTESKTPAPLSPAAKAREAKLDLASRMPPNVANMGSAATSGTMTDAEVEARLNSMSESEALKFLDSMPGLAKRIMGA